MRGSTATFIDIVRDSVDKKKSRSDMRTTGASRPGSAASRSSSGRVSGNNNTHNLGVQVANIPHDKEEADNDINCNDEKLNGGKNVVGARCSSSLKRKVDDLNNESKSVLIN